MDCDIIKSLCCTGRLQILKQSTVDPSRALFCKNSSESSTCSGQRPTHINLSSKVKLQLGNKVATRETMHIKGITNGAKKGPNGASLKSSNSEGTLLIQESKFQKTKLQYQVLYAKQQLHSSFALSEFYVTQQCTQLTNGTAQAYWWAEVASNKCKSLKFK